MPKLVVSIAGMHCRSCEILIENEYKKIPRVKSTNVNHRTGKAEIFYDNTVPEMEAISEATKNAGYTLGEKKKLPLISTDKSDYTNLVRAGIIVFVLYFLAKMTGILNYNVDTENAGLAVVILVGLVAGLSTCMALVGGLVLALSAQHNLQHPEATRWQKFQPHIFFNIGRVAGFALFGGIIGLAGSAFSPGTKTMGLLTIIVGGVMVFLGLKLVEIFPALKTWNITLPKSVSKLFGMRKERREYTRNEAVISGALTFFLPCGFTQAMQLYAVSTGSFWQGLAIMSLFALGTAPGLIGIGGLSSWFKGQKARLFFAVAGIAVIAMGIFNINNALNLLDGASPKQNITETADVQEVRMSQGFDGYSPNSFTVQKGKTVKWIITSKAPFSCAAYIVMPKYGISRPLKKGENIITFTPTETGEIPFSCSMGMYTGSFTVVEGNTTSSALPTNSKTLAKANSGTTCGMAKSGGCGGGANVPAQTNIGNGDDLSKAQIISSDYTQIDDVYPNDFTVKKGVPVKWVIKMKEPPTGCMRNIVIRDLNVVEPMSQSGETTVVFSPTQKGDFRVTCSMGIHRATIHVI